MAAKTLAGYKRLPGAARRYVNTATGEIIADRQYRKLTAASGRKTSISPQRLAIQRRAQRNYNRLLNEYTKTERAKGTKRQDGRPIDKASVRKSAEFRSIISDLKLKPTTPENRRKRRDALKRAGYRAGIPDWVPVDESPDYKSGKLKRWQQVPKARRYK
jgi:hypothetical protein